MLHLGFVSAILAKSKFEAVVDFAAANSFRCVEMMCWPKGKTERRDAGVTHIDVNAFAKNEVAYIKNYLVADTQKIFLNHIKQIIKVWY